MADETIFKATVVDPGIAAPYYYLALAREKNARREAVKLWQQFHKNLKTDSNRSFWLPVAEEKLRALGAAPAP
jgi:cytochrome c-type biogenesis protein CcmH/NrfG